MERCVDVRKDGEGNKVVFIHNIAFKGRQAIDWLDVEQYLKQFVGEVYEVDSTDDLIYIGKDLPNEYAHSNYTKLLKGGNAKAKANAVQGLPEIVEIAAEKKFYENYKEKHLKDAKFGWYKYKSRFALPVFGKNDEIEKYNVFDVVLVLRCHKDRKLYLYDFVNIKKETSTPFQS